MAFYGLLFLFCTVVDCYKEAPESAQEIKETADTAQETERMDGVYRIGFFADEDRTTASAARTIPRLREFFHRTVAAETGFSSFEWVTAQTNWDQSYRRSIETICNKIATNLLANESSSFEKKVELNVAGYGQGACLANALALAFVEQLNEEE
jgi:hypothetical protein